MDLGKEGIEGVIKAVDGSVTDTKLLEAYGINAIVNAANPSLMGSNQGVDGAIHDALPVLNDIIINELGTREGNDLIRCQRGKGVITSSGSSMCDYVIHVVGAQNDGVDKWPKVCASSRINMLESCYSEIVRIIREHGDIKGIGIPIIGAGEYKIPFDLAVRIATAGITNALLDWKNQDPELFKMSSLKNIVFFIYDEENGKKALRQGQENGIKSFVPYLGNMMIC